MQSRRELLQQALVLPLVWAPDPARAEIISEANCVSEESARGYNDFLHNRGMSALHGRVIVVAGVTRMSHAEMQMLRTRVEQGACLIWECSPYDNAPDTLLEHLFKVRTNRHRTPEDQLFIRYRWPAKAMVRTFGSFTSVDCLHEEAIAYVANTPVASIKRIGQGRLILLGSMLGPHLRAGDREAVQIARELLYFRS